MKSNLAQKLDQEKHPSLSRDNTLLSELSIRDVVVINKQGHKFSLVFKRLLWLASHKACAYCGLEIQTHEEMRVDHYLPKGSLNSESIYNYVSCCKTCNSVKCNKSLEDFRFRLAVYKSRLRGVISPSQAQQLVDLGVDLPIEIQDFYFEKIISGGVL